MNEFALPPNERLEQCQSALEVAAVLTLRVDGCIVDLSPLAPALFERPASALREQRLIEFVHPADRESYLRRYRDMLESHEMQSCTFRLSIARGNARWVEMRMAPVDDGGDVIQCRATLIDVTERILMQQEVQRLAEIVANSDDAIVSRDLEGRVTSWNRGAERMLGYAAVEMLGRPLVEVIEPEHHAATEKLAQRLRDEEPVPPFDSIWRARDGRCIPLSLSVAPVRDSSGRLLGSSLIGRDISALREGERTLRNRLRQLELLAQASHALIMGETGSPVRQDLYDRARAAVGAEIYQKYELADVPGLLRLVSFHGVADERAVPGALIQIATSPCRTALAKGAPLVLAGLQQCTGTDTAALRALGARCYAAFPLVAGGRSFGVVEFASTTRERFSDADLQVIATICDQASAMLERERLLGELREREQKLTQADRNKDEFIATLAHELRNPLAPIRNAVTIMQHQALADSQLAWCRDVIERQVTQMTRLLEDLLDVSRMTRRRIELRRQVLDLRRVVERAVETARPAIDAQQHRLSLSLPPIPVSVDADPARLTQVFANLLDNAAKYTDPRGQIAIWLTLREGRACVGVRDNGIGIAPDQLSQVFDAFTQLAPARAGSRSGLGLGLSLSRSLVELHGGHIRAHSEGVDRGSEFVVELPLAASPPAATASGAPPSAAPRRILVVDDNVDVAQTLASLLEQEGHETRTAFGGEQALQIGIQWQPDVALVDLGMPGMDGLELCRLIRAQRWGADILLIACTGWGQPGDRERARAHGFDYHLVKPVDYATIAGLLSPNVPSRP